MKKILFILSIFLMSAFTAFSQEKNTKVYKVTLQYLASEEAGKSIEKEFLKKDHIKKAETRFSDLSLTVVTDDKVTSADILDILRAIRVKYHSISEE